MVTGKKRLPEVVLFLPHYALSRHSVRVHEKQVATCVQMADHQRHGCLVEVSPVQTRPAGPWTLEAVAEAAWCLPNTFTTVYNLMLCVYVIS